MAQGDTTLKFQATQAVSWASGGPDAITNGSWSGLSDAVDLEGLLATLKCDDLIVQWKTKTSATGTLGAGVVSLHVSAATKDDSAAYNYPGQETTPQHGNKVYVDGILPAAKDQTCYGRSVALGVLFGGRFPQRIKFSVKNECSVTLAGTSGQAVQTDVWLVPVYSNVAPS